MKLIQWTIFLDMLGYGHKNSSIKNEEDANKFISFMEKNKKYLVLQEDNKKLKETYKTEWFNLYQYYDVKFAFISDSIVFTMMPKEVNETLKEEIYFLHSANALFIAAMRIFNLIFFALVEEKIFIRGGISNKFCNIKNEFAVGEGLIEAYKLESEKAIYPRILLSKEITNNSKIMESLKLISKKIYNSNYLIKKDNDGFFYLDYLKYRISQSDISSQSVQQNGLKDTRQFLQGVKEVASYLRFHKIIIEENIKKFKEKIENSQDEKSTKKYQNILKKYEWSKKYHNKILETFPKYNQAKINI
jgi:hypothetical protein